MLGNVGQLDSMNVGGSVIEQDMESRTADGLTAIELAVLFERPESVRWLIDHGATADIVSLWDLGWKDQAKQLIEQQPQIVNRKAGQNGATALHIAVQRNDEELADSVLRSMAVDHSITDDTFESSVSGWASFLGRTRMLEVLERSSSRGLHQVEK
ncbi:hypothetical protein CKM354_001009800 [Cercospora kikuchii]|uniref:Ankyrin repeat domain-containing protein n=1 Tax=Cercospora kikuchii TaxID=84275 RepID=A0A9P3FGY9_9PEZI|nr:uncharacterized protein CKM354_001009800 [Cercospora kikuchii]GIZ46996.1 hypothetical protein CKM354_001009800 [Cercospora kikuchii]